MSEIMTKVAKMIDNVELEKLMTRSLSAWRPMLAMECQVYVFNEGYIAKRFDQINYVFCSKDTAKEILVDNLYSLLRFKYFKHNTEEVDARINDIIKSFTTNLKTTLRKITIQKNTDGEYVSLLPNYCLAFKNGVYDFFHDKWLFKYDIIELKDLHNKIYMYTHEYIVLWYFNFEFEPLDVSIADTPLTDFIDIMKTLTSEPDSRNYCFELLYNISHDSLDEFSMHRFVHLCEIIGYSILQEFCQSFVMLIGSGQNGKNSLFDGCLTPYLVPRPTSNSLDDIENDAFITGSLENHFMNIFLETSPKTYTESTNLKNLTGSQYQTINSKGVQKYQSYINCKHIFAGNDQENIKFSDTTTGFRRRVNLFEIWYHWDPEKTFLKKGDYYDTSFSDNLHELTNDTSNVIAYIYFAMYGIFNATKNFTRQFLFTENDWKLQYSDIDFGVKDSIDSISVNQILEFMKKYQDESKLLFFDIDRKRLYNSKTLAVYGYNSFEGMMDFFNNDEDRTSYFADNDCYMNIKMLQRIAGDVRSAASFTQAFKKIYNPKDLQLLTGNKLYVKVNFSGKRLKIITL